MSLYDKRRGRSLGREEHLQLKIFRRVLNNWGGKPYRPTEWINDHEELIRLTTPQASRFREVKVEKKKSFKKMRKYRKRKARFRNPFV